MTTTTDDLTARLLDLAERAHAVPLHQRTQVEVLVDRLDRLVPDADAPPPDPMDAIR